MLQARPHLVNVPLTGFFLFLLLPGVPCAYLQESRHIHAVDLIHAPAGFQKRVIGGINEFGQRQNSGISSASVVGCGLAGSFAAFAGNSLSRIYTLSSSSALIQSGSRQINASSTIKSTLIFRSGSFSQRCNSKPLSSRWEISLVRQRLWN